MNFPVANKPIVKLEVQYFETQDKAIKATILISLVNGIVKWWDYETLNLYSKLNWDHVIDFSYFKSKHTPFIGLITDTRYIHLYRLDDFWTFSKIAKVKLKKQPLNFIIHKDRGIISYADNYEFFKISNSYESEFDLNKDVNYQKLKIETQKLLSKSLVENQTVPIIYLEGVKAFIITKSKCSYYVDEQSGSINKGSSIRIVWKSGTPIQVIVVRPYLVGIMHDAIEIKCLFNPNRVIQIINDPFLNVNQICVNRGTIDDEYMSKLESLFVYTLDSHENIPVHKLSELTQIDGELQVLNLTENELYSTATKIWDFLISKKYKGFSQEKYQNLQK